VVSGARPGIEDAPRLDIALLNMFRDRRRDHIKMSCVEKSCPMVHLQRGVTSGSGLACPAVQQIDVALAGKIEPMPVPTDDCASGSS
jgi:hypothetical protein